MITNRKIFALNITSSLFSNGAAVLFGILLVPAALSYWHETIYGIWVLITTFISYLSLTNFGLNSAATALISKSPTYREKIALLKKCLLIMLAYLALLIIVALILGLLGNVWALLIGKIDESTQKIAYHACTIMFLFFTANLVFSLISSALIGFQKAYIDNFIQAFVPIVNYVSLLAVIKIQGNLESFALISGIGLSLLNIFKLYAFWAMLRRRKRSPENVSILENEIGYKAIFFNGLQFFLMNIAVIIAWNTDNIAISRIMGIEYVTKYSITLKLFTILYSLVNMIGISFSPVLAKEIGANNWGWINKTYKALANLLTIVGGCVCLGGILFAKNIIFLWTGSDGYAGPSVVVVLSVYGYFLTVNNFDAVAINTFNYTRKLGLIYMASSCIKLFFSIFLLKSYGLVGAALGTLIAAVLFTSWIFPLWLQRNSLGKLNSSVYQAYSDFLRLAPFIAAAIFISIKYDKLSISKISFASMLLIMYCGLHLINRENRERIFALAKARLGK